ncbi:MAG: hypothetical protein KDB61_02715 [Planctomycetes bacterium]|nr:hypothetical protein [Planctomycetota bacterium]
MRVVRRRVRARLFAIAAWCLGNLPPSLATRILAIPAVLANRGRLGRMVRSNLELALGDEFTEQDRRACSRAVFHHTARLIAEATFLSQANARRRRTWFERHVTIDPSIEHLERALGMGRGVILATGHLGNWELIAPSMVDRGLHGAVVAQFNDRDPAAPWIVNMRRNAGVETLSQDAHPKELLRLLKEGGALGIVCDLEVKRVDGVFVPFFGRDALTMTAPAALARASKAPIVPVHCVHGQEDPTRYTIRFDPPMEWDASMPKIEARDAILTGLNQTIEGWIRRVPEEWAWYQPRWRTRPKASDS